MIGGLIVKEALSYLNGDGFWQTEEQERVTWHTADPAGPSWIVAPSKVYFFFFFFSSLATADGQRRRRKKGKGRGYELFFSMRKDRGVAQLLT